MPDIKTEREQQQREDTDLADKDWEVWDDSPAPTAASLALLGYELNPSPVREVCVYVGPTLAVCGLPARSLCLRWPSSLHQIKPQARGEGLFRWVRNFARGRSTEPPSVQPTVGRCRGAWGEVPGKKESPFENPRRHPCLVGESFRWASKTESPEVRSMHLGGTLCRGNRPMRISTGFAVEGIHTIGQRIFDAGHASGKSVGGRDRSATVSATRRNNGRTFREEAASTCEPMGHADRKNSSIAVCGAWSSCGTNRIRIVGKTYWLLRNKQTWPTQRCGSNHLSSGLIAMGRAETPAPPTRHNGLAAVAHRLPSGPHSRARCGRPPRP